MASILASLACGPMLVEPQDALGTTSSTTDPTTGELPSTSSSSGGATTRPAADETSTGTEPGPPGAGFIDDPDLGDGPVACDPFLQNCPPGEKCTAYAIEGGSSWNGTGCFPVADDPGGPGDPCTMQGSNTSGIDDCEVGTMCWDVDPRTLVGTCVSWCAGDEYSLICADPNTTCRIGSDGPLALCLPICHPLHPNCEADELCVPISDEWECAPDASMDGGAYGSPCEFINVCEPGLVCLGADAVPGCLGNAGCCSDVCDLNAPRCTGAAEGATCQAWYQDPPPGYEDVGVCALPS